MSTIADSRRLVQDALLDVAPDLDATVDPHARLQEDLGLDSMDVLNLFAAISDAAGVDIPERDYEQLATVAGCIAYLQERA
jgi:acyl carrier protein